jgi:hypothetical protein
LEDHSLDRILPLQPYYDSQAAGIQGPISADPNRHPLRIAGFAIPLLVLQRRPVEACMPEKMEAVGYIDDVSTLAVGPSAQRNCKTLKKIHQKAEQWAVKHGSQFAPAKYKLVHFTRDPRKQHTCALLTTRHYRGLHVMPLPGYSNGHQLGWDDHREKIEAAATKRLSALSALASSTWGTGAINLRHVYRAMIVPQVLYGCSAWHNHGNNYASRGYAMTSTIQRIQRRAA